jgi:alkylated DNA repair dioxygenase AlkB
MPDGFRYEQAIVNEEEEIRLATALQTLDLKPFEFHGHLGKRRVVSFGPRYDYDRREIGTAADLPGFLEDLRKRAANFAGHSPEAFRQIGINEYRPGAGIGWHRDKPQFGDVIGVSLLAPARMRLRKREGARWLRRAQVLEPRSIYILSGPARSLWEHSIPPVPRLRYAVMFRTLADNTSI